MTEPPPNRPERGKLKLPLRDASLRRISPDITRRDALTLLAALGAAASLPACRRPDEKILPYVRQPEDIVPGNPLHFATVLSLMGSAFGIVVESHEGRPTKIEGNPLHPESLGATSSFTQAAILDLYDPDRSRGPSERGVSRSWQDAEAMLAGLGASLSNDNGRSLAVITGCHRSPTMLNAVRALAKAYPNASIIRYEPFTRNACHVGLQWLYGRPLEPVYDLTQADVILSLDADFMALEGSPVRLTREWATRRDPNQGSMNRLYVFESTMTVTGSNADHRFACPSGSVLDVVSSLLAHPAACDFIPDEGLKSSIQRMGKRASHGLAPRQVELIAKDLQAHRGRSLVLPGERQPPAVHALAHLLNLALDNVGKTVRYFRPFDSSPEGAEALEQVAHEAQSGRISTVMLLGVNPAYDAPGDVDVAAMLKRLALSIHVGTHFDETAALSTWHLNRAHPLESWGDAESENGTASIAQPLIAPLFGGRTDTEIIRLLLGKKASDFDCVQETWRKAWGAIFDANWRRALHDGIVSNSALAPETVSPQFDALCRTLENLSPTAPSPLELVFVPDSHTYDGRFANNPWLLELPDPLSKVTWTNVARVSAQLARARSLSDGDIVTLRAENRETQASVLVAPGQAANTVTVSIGQGRRTGVSKPNQVGTNFGPLRRTQSPYLVPLTNLSKLGNRTSLPRTQEHFSAEGRPLARESRLGERLSQGRPHAREPKAPSSSHGTLSSWGMAIDLGKCTGCNACIVACQAENNVSVVGPEGIRRNRGMHWLRVDRYFTGPSDEPTTVSQPVLCQQCDNAPCESVCPVGATSHSPEGLNDMAYNRCVGSRYCAANCPFKVRRFNYFEYWANASPTHRMQLNPDVTVRSRGVMEKCTFCVQRINKVKIEQKKLGNSQIEDGSVAMACEQACPAGAITFGNLADPASRLASIVTNARGYRLLDELNLESRVSYLVKIRNPNPELLP